MLSKYTFQNLNFRSRVALVLLVVVGISLPISVFALRNPRIPLFSRASSDDESIVSNDNINGYTSNAPTYAELEAIGLLSVTSKGADPTCTRDSTAAIQNAIDEAHEREMAVLFPSGTYCVSDTLWGVHTSDSETSGHEFIGSTIDTPPVLRLKQNSPGFNNTASPKAVIVMHTIRGREGGNPGQSVGDIDDAVGYRQSIRNIDIEVEPGNSGAVGIELTGAQGNSLQNIDIRLKSGYAGFSGFVGTNSVITNIQVEGGKYGITRSTQGGTVKWPSMTDVRLLDQTDAAIFELQPTNFMISGLYIRKLRAPAIVTGSGDSTNGNFTLLDTKIAFTNHSTEPVIRNSSDKAITLINYFVYNGASGPGVWKHISEYSYPGGGVNVINGSIQSTVYQKEHEITVFAPPLNLLTKHAINVRDFPSPDAILAKIKAGDGRYANAADYGILPATSGWQNEAYGQGFNSNPDISEPLKALIESGVQTILIPKGKYVISDTIELGRKTHLTGIGNQFSGFIMSDNWKPTASNPATMLRTPDLALASPKISFLRITWRTEPTSYDYFRGIVHIRSGKTIMNDTHVRPNTSTRTSDLHPNVRFLFTGKAGGKFYGLSMGSNGPRNQHPEYRHLLIDGTRRPIIIYGANPEDQSHSGAPGWAMEVKNAQNVAFLGSKQENHNSLLVQNSKNVVALSLSNFDNVNFVDSNNFLGSIYPKNYIDETIYKEGGVDVLGNKELALFKRGEIRWFSLF